jgi:hypothetical protein
VVPEPADAHASAAGTLCRASCCGGTAAIRLVTRLERANTWAADSRRQANDKPWPELGNIHF